MRGIFILLASLFSLPTMAIITSFSESEVALMHTVFSQHQSDFTRHSTQARLNENQYLLAQAHKHQPRLLTRQADVGYATVFHTRRYVLSLLKSHFTDINLPSAPKIDWSLYTKTALLADLPPYPNDNQYSPMQLTQLESINLAPLTGMPFTLAELMLEQSMQNRYKLHQGDYALFKKLIGDIRQYHHLVTSLATHLTRSGIALKHLNLIAVGELLRSPMLNYFGVQSHMHGERSPYVEVLKRKITHSDITAFYVKNKADFKHKSRVTASGVLFSTSQAATAFKQVAQATSFKKALKQYALKSIFSDTQGKVTRKQNSQWAHQVVFSLKESLLTGPIRSPDGKWLVAQTHHIKFDYYAIDSETVRYQATLALIEDLAQQTYRQNKQAWLKTHKLSL